MSRPITLWFIVKFLTPEDQGYYYTFANIIGLQVFFELGLSTVIMQFASHEKAHLEWSAAGILEGPLRARSRLASLLRLAMAYYCIAGILIVAVVLPLGWFFFSRHGVAQVHWQIPWVLTVLTTAGTLSLSPVMVSLEGCALISEIAGLRTVLGCFNTIVLWLLLAGHFVLASAPIANLFSLAGTIVWLLLKKKKALTSLLQARLSDARVSWWGEIWPMQWRIAISWMSGYLIFQLFTPVLFAFRGPREAGQMGLSLSLAMTLVTISMSWLYAKAPLFGGLISRGDYAELDRIFGGCVNRSLLVFVTGGAVIWGADLVVNSLRLGVGQRILDPNSILVLLGATMCYAMVSLMAAFLRGHKREPFLGLSVAMGILCLASTYFLGRPFGATGIVWGYFLINLIVGLGGGYWVFKRFKRAWRAKNFESSYCEPLA